MLRRLFVLVTLFTLVAMVLAPAALAAEVSVTVDGQSVVFPDQQPVVDANSRVLVPIRYVMEMMGVDVKWEPFSNQAVLTKGTTTAVFTIGSSQYTIDGAISSMDTAPIALNDRTLFPVRYAVEAFEGAVEWDANTDTVLVVSAQAPPPGDEQSQDEDQAQDGDSNQQAGYPLAINGVLPGSTLDFAKKAWGEPDSFSEDPEESNIVVYRFGSIYCDVYDGNQVVAIRTEDPGDSTGLGIHPGDPVPDLINKYGDPYPAASEFFDNATGLYKWHYGYVNSTDTASSQLAVGTGYYHITFWCHGTQNTVQTIESSYGYR